MPLQRSKSKEAFKKNVGTLMGEVGKSPHVQSKDQALAIAYDIKRKGRADGGAAPWWSRAESRQMMHTGPINSAVPGRTDRHNMAVPSGAYVVPADVVSHLGQNNSAAGMSVLGQMFGANGPYGSGKTMPIRAGAGAPRPRRKRGGFADGGTPEDESVGEPTEIIAAGGEYVIDPSVVMAIGGGDIKRGHEILDAFVLSNHKQHVKTLRKLPGPARD